MENSKPEDQDREVSRIFDRKTGRPVGSYRTCHDVYEFATPQEARDHDFHNMFSDRTRYRIARYRVRVSYELIEEDVSPPPTKTT